MRTLLLTMGPSLSLAPKKTEVQLYEPHAVFLFQITGAVGEVTNTVLDSDLPPEWGRALYQYDMEGTVYLEALEPVTPGNYFVSIMAVDSEQYPVSRTFQLAVVDPYGDFSGLHLVRPWPGNSSDLNLSLPWE